MSIHSQNQFLTSIKGRNSAGNLRKMMLYNLNVDDNVYTKSGKILSIHSQDIEQSQSRAVTLLQISKKRRFTIPT